MYIHIHIYICRCIENIYTYIYIIHLSIHIFERMLTHRISRPQKSILFPKGADGVLPPMQVEKAHIAVVHRKTGATHEVRAGAEIEAQIAHESWRF